MIHGCASCGSSTRCSSLTVQISGQFEGLGICERCVSVEDKRQRSEAGNKGISSKGNTWRRLRDEYMMERRKHHPHEDAEQREGFKRLEAVVARYALITDWSEFGDEYVPSAVRKSELLVNKARVNHPQLASIDAIRQVYRDPVTEQSSLHVAGNVAMTSRSLNHMKHTWPVGVLAIVRDWVAKEEAPTNEERLNFMALPDSVHRVGSETPYVQAARIGNRITRRAFDKMCRCWREMRPWKEMHTTEMARRYISHPRIAPLTADGKPWKPDNIVNFMKCVTDMKTKTAAKYGSIPDLPTSLQLDDVVDDPDIC